MEDELNGVHSHEMPPEDDKALRENNKKRTLKTHAQLQALEKFYNEHKYPGESMKAQLAVKIGLTEKQVSEWFCHRRLKDKRLLANKNCHVILKQDRSSVVIQEHGSGHMQDSCGSTKQVENRNFDTREVESQRLTLHEYTLAHEQDNGRCLGTHNRMDDASSGSNSSLRNMANHGKGSPFDMPSSRQRGLKFPTDATGLMNPRPGPAGYLKVKGQVENAAITAVKRQLGKHYREDGPPLGIGFDLPPPGVTDDRETCYTGEPVPPASPDFSKFHQYPKSSKGHEYNSRVAFHNPRVAFHNPNINGTSFKVPQMPDISNNYVHQRYKQNTNFSNNGSYYTQRDSFEKFPEVSPREISVTKSRDDYGMKYRNGVQVMRTSSFPSSRHLQPYGGNLRREKQSCFSTFSNLPKNGYKRGVIENGSPNLTGKGFDHRHSFDKMQPRRIAKDGKTYADGRIENENQIRIPYKNDRNDLKRMRDECPQQPYLKKSLMVDYQSRTYHASRSVEGIPAGFSEDETSAETASSVE